MTRVVLFRATLAVLIAVLLQLVTPSAAGAQQTQPTLFKPRWLTGLILKGGPTSTGLSEPQGQFAAQSRWDPGWFAGLMFNRYDHQRIGIAAETLAGHTGVTEIIGSTSTRPIVYRWSFVQLPIVARFSFGGLRGGRRPINVLAGLALDRRFRTTVTDGTSVTKLEGTTNSDAIFGAGVELHGVVVEGRFMQGLSSLGPAESALGKKRLRTFSVVMGFRLR